MNFLKENYSSHIKKPNLNIKQRKNGEQIDKKCDEIIKDKTIEQKITRKEFPVFNLNKPSFLSTGPFKSVERPIDYDPLLKTSSRWRNKQNDEKQQINKNKLNESDIINLEIDNNKRTNLFDQSNKEEKSENEYVELYNLQQMNILCSMNNSTQSQIDISSYNQNTNEWFQETSAILYKPSLHSQNSTQSQLNQNQKS